MEVTQWPKLCIHFRRSRISEPVESVEKKRPCFSKESLEIELRTSPTNGHRSEPLLIEKSIEPRPTRAETGVDPYLFARSLATVEEIPVCLILLHLRAPHVDDPARRTLSAAP